MGLYSISQRLLIAACFVCASLVIAANFLPIIRKNVYNTKIYMWKTCETRPRRSEFCGTNRESSFVCSELDSRVRAMAAFAAISICSLLLLVAVIIQEIRGKAFPVRNLPKMLLAWAFVSLMVVGGLNIGTLMARLCDSSLTLREQGGSLGLGAYLFLGAFAFLLIFGMLYVMAPPESDSGRLDDDDDDAAGSDAKKLGRSARGPDNSEVSRQMLSKEERDAL